MTTIPRRDLVAALPSRQGHIAPMDRHDRMKLNVLISNFGSFGDIIPFLDIGRALREPAEREAWSAARDLHTMRLLARAYAAA